METPRNIAVTIPLVVALFVEGCGRDQSPCDELNQLSPDVKLASDDARCSQLVQFANVVSEAYHLPFREWLKTVAAQRTDFVLATIDSMTLRTSWLPASFAREPAEMPCGGLAVTDDYWNQSILSKVLPTRPERLFVSLALNIDANVAHITTYQDFDCDGKDAELIFVGQFKQGLSPYRGGWTLLSNQLPPLDE